ncbi:MAG TPA: ATP-dependent DNA ligase [Dermatophilaceae bacterium]|nr:ATP-dependent DNA ligase [Dermatophilaceae bacterium]
MDLPLSLPVSPMLAKSVPTIPEPDSVAGGLCYEPKWDGFRCIVLRDGDDVELASRGSRPLTRYFPEVADAARRFLPARCAVDTEIVVRSGPPGAQRLNWEALAQRIHPAASRIARLSAETPAELVCFDLLAVGDEDITGQPFSQRRARLQAELAGLSRGDPIHLTRTTTDPALARSWFDTFEGAGLDGIVAKPLAAPYRPGKRAMFKVKHSRSADVVAVGYRVHKSGHGLGSLLCGLYGADGVLRNVGGIVAFSNARRVELIDELAPLVIRDDAGQVVAAQTDRSRFSSATDVGYVPLRPERVVEVAFDQLEGQRFRHAVTFVRWRPDREPSSCLLDQVDRATAYDLDAVLLDS